MSMMRERTRHLVILLLLGALTAACGAVRRESGAATQLEIVNDVLPPVSLTIDLVPIAPPGIQRFIGNVDPSATRTFTLRDPVGEGSFQLIARAPGGSRMRSQPFDLLRGETVRWQVTTNQITRSD